jgi:IMP dehydrogenase/GMP reductase
MTKKNPKNLFDFDDILIQPEIITNISSRSEITPYYVGKKLPLMTAPMDTVIDENNFIHFNKVGITPILPRIKNPDYDYVDTNLFLSYSLIDFKKIFIESRPKISENEQMFALIDVANGHMGELYDASKEAKRIYGERLVLMVGNVANPETFELFCSINVDYVRIGIGNGGGCLTTQNTGIGYPMGSLIEECNKVGRFDTKIVADGGFKKYSDVIKALALGADYVMLGSILNKALESAGQTTKENGEIINQYSDVAKESFKVDIPLYKNFRGMSTKEVQKAWGKEELTTSEGVVRRHQVEYTLEGWVENFTHYLKSAMSYTNKKTLPEFIGKVNYNFISENSLNRFQK